MFLLNFVNYRLINERHIAKDYFGWIIFWVIVAKMIKSTGPKMAKKNNGDGGQRQLWSQFLNKAYHAPVLGLGSQIASKCKQTYGGESPVTPSKKHFKMRWPLLTTSPFLSLKAITEWLKLTAICIWLQQHWYFGSLWSKFGKAGGDIGTFGVIGITYCAGSDGSDSSVAVGRGGNEVILDGQLLRNESYCTEGRMRATTQGHESATPAKHPSTPGVQIRTSGIDWTRERTTDCAFIISVAPALLNESLIHSAPK